jgi:hypothetical protein
MKNMDKGLTVPKWVLIVWPEIPQMPQNLSAQFVCPKVLDFNEKKLHWVSVVRECFQIQKRMKNSRTIFSKRHAVPGPEERFQMKWGHAYAIGVICPLD